MGLVRTDNFAGMPLYFDRFTEDSYGEIARAFQPVLDEDFVSACDACFEEVQENLTEHGMPIVQIWCGGAGQTGGGKSYRHRNRAFDLDGLVFANTRKWLADSFPDRPFLYLGIESCLRRHFGTVLNHDFSEDFTDRLYFDNGSAPQLKQDARSHAVFVQNALVLLFNHDIGEVGIDGVFGPATDAALRSTLKEFDIGALSKKANWLEFLATCSEEALAAETSIVTAD